MPIMFDERIWSGGGSGCIFAPMRTITVSHTDSAESIQVKLIAEMLANKQMKMADVWFIGDTIRIIPPDNKIGNVIHFFKRTSITEAIAEAFTSKHYEDGR